MESHEPHHHSSHAHEHGSHHHPHPHPHPHIEPVRVEVKRSTKYKFNGKASYLYALRKYNFNPPYLPFIVSNYTNIVLGVRGKFSSMNLLVLLLKDPITLRSGKLLRPMFKMIPCTFAPLQLEKAKMPLLSTWILILEVLISGVNLLDRDVLICSIVF
jgi:hypothetical protein